MLSLAERVDRTILRYSLLPPGARVIVALSGGADSTALACLLVDLATRRGFVVAAAAHFDHRLRPASGEDQEFCRRLAERLGLPWAAAEGDVRGFAVGHGRSLEDASRQLRYDFLSRAAGDFGATHVAVGHTRDDQAETVLLQMVRGAGPRGLRGMAPSRRLAGVAEEAPASGEAPLLVRPLLEVGHDELVAWLQARRQAFREDESNHDRRFLRNRVRHEVIPFLRDQFSPSIVAVLARNAEIAASDAELLESLAGQAFGRLAATGDGTVEMDREGLLREPDAIRRRVVLLAFGNLRGVRSVGRDQVARVLALAAGRIKGPLALPGATASAVGPRLVLVRLDASRRSFSAGMNFSSCALSTPGEARLAGFLVSSFVCSWNGSTDAGRLRAPGAGTVEAVVDASRVSGLSVRTRRPGDWFRPLGLGGRKKKLQDYFVDRKVPREARDRVPLVVDRSDRIVWVAGHGIDEEFRVRDGTRDVVILKLRGESA